MAYSLQVNCFYFGLGTSEMEKHWTSECNQTQQVFKDRRMWGSFYHCQT